MTTDTEYAAKYPEHARLKAAKPQIAVVKEFLDWMEENGFTVCKDDRAENEEAARRNPARDGWKADCDPTYEPAEEFQERYRQQLFARFSGVDPDRLAAEKDLMVDEMQSASAPKAGS